MKKLLLALSALLSIAPALAQGIEFSHVSFAEGLEKARAENKMVFIDCFTEWCGPCKMLSANVFTQAEVGELFNSRFVNLKIDMEKGEGVELAKRFAITAYPTLLMLDAEGNVQHRVVGYIEPAALIEHGRTALEGTKTLSALALAWEEGGRELGMVRDYIVALIAGNEDGKAMDVAAQFFAMLDERQKADPALWPIYSNAKVARWGSPWLDFLIGNKAVFDAAIGREVVDSVIREAATDIFLDALFARRESVGLDMLPGYAEQIRSIDFEGNEIVAAEAEFTTALTGQDAARTVELFEKYGTRFSRKGIMNFVPYMLQSPADPEKFPATAALADLIKKMSEQ